MQTALSSQCNTQLHVLCFHLNYSGSFHLMQPLINDLKDDYKKKLKISLVKKGSDVSLENKYQINFFPTFILMCNQEVLVRIHGLVNRKEVYDHINQLLKIRQNDQQVND